MYLKPFQQLKDKYVGAEGTPERAAYEAELKEELKQYISFNEPMLEALRAGRKTQTRRMMRPQPVVETIDNASYWNWTANKDEAGEEQGGLHNWRNVDDFAAALEEFCPLAKVGAILHVKEDPSIALQILSVRAERVNSISYADATAEGVGPDKRIHGGNVIDKYGLVQSRSNFAEIWDAIYGENAWKLNSWVWVLEFKQVQP